MTCEQEQAVYLAAEADLLEADLELAVAQQVRQQAHVNWYMAVMAYYNCLYSGSGNRQAIQQDEPLSLMTFVPPEMQAEAESVALFAEWCATHDPARWQRFYAKVTKGRQ